ncbi:MAG: hypothetical protein EBS29_09950, partial [Chloroflexia bacterium]|nr:hypothetical protein [Chloroflexia bacterium]
LAQGTQRAQSLHTKRHCMGAGASVQSPWLAICIFHFPFSIFHFPSRTGHAEGAEAFFGLIASKNVCAIRLALYSLAQGTQRAQSLHTKRHCMGAGASVQSPWLAICIFHFPLNKSDMVQ